jgi:peptide/nickel transport system permease protein
MGKILRGDLGESITEHRPVIEMIKERLPLTFKLNISSEILFYLLSIPLGLMAARNRYAGPIRRAIFDTSSGVVLLVLYSMPAIFLGTLLIAWFSRGGWLEGWLIANHHEGWLWAVMPIGGVTSEQADKLGYWAYLGDVCWHFILPVVTMTVGGLAFMSKLARASLLENLRMDYVRTAYAKGLKDRVVVYVHALRNSLLPMITILAGILPAMIGGSLIIEYIFNLPGMGMLYWTAVTRRDYEMIQAEALIGASLTLLAILICDIMYAVVDPRVRYD